MSDPLLILVLLGGAGGDPTTEAMMSAARAALGPEAVVVADSSAQSRSDAESLEVAIRMRARAVVRVAWGDPSKPTVHLHVHVEPLQEWADDEISFDPHDAAGERGRTVGFAFASMVQRLERAREEAAAIPTAPAPPAPPAPPRAETVPVDSRPAAPGPNIDSGPRDATERARPRFTAEAAGTAAVGGAAGGFGGAVAARWSPFERLAVRGGAGARAGSVDGANASSTVALATLGGGLTIHRSAGFELGMRAEFVLMRFAVSRTQLGAEMTHSRWLSGVDVLGELAWWALPRLAITGAAGSELAFGATDVTVGGEVVARVPSFRGIGEVGARVLF